MLSIISSPKGLPSYVFMEQLVWVGIFCTFLPVVYATSGQDAMRRNQGLWHSCLLCKLFVAVATFSAKFHELPPILLIFGPVLQIIIYLMILASMARHTNIMDITGAAAFGHGPVVFLRLACLASEAKIINYITIWSPGPNISNIGSSWNLGGWSLLIIWPPIFH